MLVRPTVRSGLTLYGHEALYITAMDSGSGTQVSPCPRR